MPAPHIPVLQEEVVAHFAPIEEGVMVDCTLGYGGHAEAILKANPRIFLIGIDRDTEAIAFAQKRLAPYKERIKLLHGAFSEILPTLQKLPIRAILADIGVSSLQLDKRERGFGFESDTLDMRMDPRQPLSAYDVVNSYPASELERIFREYAQVRESKRAAQLICAHRPFTSAAHLSSMIARHMRGGKIHPATLIFQAIRIEVNDELGELKRLLDSIKNLKLTKTLVGIISFHSLEDRIVKRTFKEWSRSCICPPEAMRCACGADHALGRIVTKRPITPTRAEIVANPRSRSAKLRIFEIDRPAHP